MALCTTCPDDIKERIISLEKHLSDPFAELNIERVLDVFISAVLDSQCTSKTQEKAPIFGFANRFAETVTHLQCLRRQRHDFSFIANLGRGAYGQVNLVRETATGRVCAMKILNKNRMLSQQADFWAEREIMSRSTSPWLVRLFYAFQDVKSLYMVMEYVPGGTLVSWMDEVELISESVCRFYTAELVLALTDLHEMGFIHRDLKPDNLLIDLTGHLKLVDFGTCVRVDPTTGRVQCDSAVGTPDYISPEVLYSQSSGGGEYGFPVDWWALGVLVYEMICGETPFYSDDLVTTYSKIMSHTSASLHFPDDIVITPSCLDFITNLLSPEETRLGSRNGASEVSAHAWFSPNWAEEEELMNKGQMDDVTDDMAFFDWSWRTIRVSRAPFQPKLTSETDTSYFHDDGEGEDEERENEVKKEVDLMGNEDAELGEKVNDVAAKSIVENGSEEMEGNQLNFAGFTFSRPQTHRLAPLCGCYLVPPSCHPSKRASMRLQPAVSPMPSYLNALADASSRSSMEEKEQDTSLSIRVPSTPQSVVMISEDVDTDGEEKQEVEGNQSDQMQLIGLVAELEQLLEEAQNRHGKETKELTLQLQDMENRLAKSELHLATTESQFSEKLRDSERLVEAARLELASTTSKLEAEISKWKAMAESEKLARQMAEVQKSKAANLLAKRAVDAADRLAGSDISRCGSESRRQASLPVKMPASMLILSKVDGVSTGSQANLDILNTSVTSSPASPVNPAMEKKVQELMDRVDHLKEQLQFQQEFSNLHKNACEEKKDQLLERDRQIATACEALETAKQTRDQIQLASRYALMQEQERSAQYLECLKAAEKSSEAANRRAQVASSEAATLREQVAQLRDSLVKHKEDLATEKLKCNAAVSKIQKILSGDSADALELMMLSEMEKTVRETGGIGGDSVGGQFINTLGGGLGGRKLGQKKFTSQQHLFRQMDRKYKRLVADMEQLQSKHRLEMKEARNMFNASQEAAQQARMQASKLAEEVVHLKQSKSGGRENASNAPSSKGGQVSHLRRFHLYTSKSPLSLSATAPSMPPPSGQIDTGGDDSTDYPLAAATRIRTSPSLNDADPLQIDHQRNLSGLSDFENLLEGSSRSPSLLHRVSSLSGRTAALRGFLPSPQSSLGGGTDHQRNPKLLPINFGLSGQLEVPAKPGRRKKLAWEPRFAKLTANRLLLWDVAKSELMVTSPDEHASQSSKQNAATFTLRAGPNLLVDLPLTSILHCRSVTSCDVLHAPPDDLPCIFQIIFDQCISLSMRQQQKEQSVAKTSLPPKTSSPSVTNNQHCVTPPPKSAPPTGLFGAARTLPRKLSFSSSTHFSISGGRSSSTTTPAMAKKRTGGSTQFLWASSGGSMTSLVGTVGSGSPKSLGARGGGPIAHQGHVLQRIQYRVPAVCELCKRSCWHVISPPPALQCIHCQVKLHAYHLEKRDLVLRPCGKSTAILLFRASSEEQKTVWLAGLLSAIASSRAAASGKSDFFHPPHNHHLNSVTSSESSSNSVISLYSPVNSTPQSGAALSPDDQPRKPIVVFRSATLPLPSPNKVPFAIKDGSSNNTKNSLGGEIKTDCSPTKLPSTFSTSPSVSASVGLMSTSLVATLNSSTDASPLAEQ